MVPPYNVRSQIIGAMAMVPVLHPGTVVRAHTGTRAQLVAAMDNVRATYAAYLANPHLPAVTAVAGRMMPLKTVPVTRNPNEAVVNNVGVVERVGGPPRRGGGDGLLLQGHEPLRRLALHAALHEAPQGLLEDLERPPELLRAAPRRRRRQPAPPCAPRRRAPPP